MMTAFFEEDNDDDTYAVMEEIAPLSVSEDGTHQLASLACIAPAPLASPKILKCIH